MTDVARGTEQETVTISVDGREVEARPGEMVIAAAERAGVYIPRFCYHPRLEPVGMCRMCLVNIDSGRGPALQPACVIPVADDMSVDTTSDNVTKAQDGVLEFLLINHPLDCPVCDKGGECPLQDQTFAFGPGESRFVEEKRHYEKPIALSELVHLDRERCILCDRCTRFSRDVAGDPLISFIDRGFDTQINTFPDHPFASYFSGNTVQLCPVGALLATPYRFRARPWDLEQVESTCTTCSVGCRVAAQSSQDQVVRLVGVDVDPVNHGWLCDKGRFAYEATASPGRITEPRVRGEGGLRTVGWVEALDRAAAGIGQAVESTGPGSVAVLGGARLTNEDAYAWSRLARAVIGTDHVDCQLGDGLPAELVLGLPRATIDEACTAPVVLVMAPDLKEELPVLYLRLRAAAVDGGVQLVEISPRATALSEHAAVTLHHRPGEVAALAAALTGDSREAAAGVAAEAIDAARTLLGFGADAPTDLVCVLGRPSLAEPAEATVEAASALASALPQLRFLPALRRANVMGALDMGLAPGVLPGRVGLGQGRDWFTEAWGSLPAEAGLDADGILRAAVEGKVGALVLLGADPLRDFPDRALARDALAAARFVVALDLFETESTGRADVVLPVAGPHERVGTTTNVEGRISLLGQKVTAPGTVRADWMVAVELARRLGGELPFTTAGEIWTEIEHLAASHRGITEAVLRSPVWRDGVPAPFPAAPVTIDTRPPGDHTSFERVEGENLPSPEGGETETAEVAAVQNAPTHASTVVAGNEGTEPEVEGSPAASPADGGADAPPMLRWEGLGEAHSGPNPDSYSLRLVTHRELYDAGELVAHSPHLEPLARGTRVTIGTYDSERLGVSTGDQVKVTSPRGSFEVPVVVDPGVPRSAAFIAFNQPGTGAADLIESGQPATEIRVETV